MITITNNDEQKPVIFRIMRRKDGETIDCISEAQLLPAQSVNLDVDLEQSIVVFAR